MKFEGISTALKDGCQLHAFRSGGGLMVVRVSEADGKLRGYGEHPHIEAALNHSDEDYLAGGREYKEVYGKIHPRYFTGTNEAISPLDAWIKQGRTFDAYWENEEFVAVLHRTGDGFDSFTQTGRGTTFDEAQVRAFAAEQVKETMESHSRY